MADSTITIVHVSDLHAREGKESEFQKRTKAFFSDVEKLSLALDLVVVTGDIAFSGRSNEYDLAYSSFFEPIQKRLHLSSDRVIVCPGNHDINRTQIDQLVEKGLQSSITDTITAEDFLDHPECLKRQNSYISFISKLYGKTFDRCRFSSEYTIKGLTLGFAAFDSSWRCSDDKSEGRLFLTMRQINELYEKVQNANLKIAIMHHPLNWFHPSESKDVLSDLRRQFDVVLTGHLHNAESYSMVTPASEYIQFTVPSLFDGSISEIPDGYNIYSIDYPERKITVNYRKFIRNRISFDRNVDHAPDGIATFSLPTTALTHYRTAMLAQKITSAGNDLLETIKNSLKDIQRLEQPVLVTPLVKELEWGQFGKTYRKVPNPIEFAIHNSCLVYGPPDVGTTIFLKSIAAEINCNAKNRFAVYVDYHSQTYFEKSEEHLLRYIKNKTDEAGIDSGDVSLSLIVDHISATGIESLNLLLKTALKYKWHIVASVKSDVIFDTLSASEKDSGLRFLNICHWGPSRLREFINAFIKSEKLKMDSDAAFQFVRNSFAISDLPVTPIVAALYLRAFTELGSQLTGLPFLRLLERIEERNLDREQLSSTYSIYNFRLWLRKLSVLCFQNERNDFSLQEYKSYIKDYFESKNLEVDVDRFIEYLTKSGIVAIDGEYIYFTYCAFLDFYLAQALETKELSITGHLCNLDRALCLGDAMAFYAGRKRDDQGVASDLLRCIEDEYQNAKEITADDLENHIKHLLSQPTPMDARDEVATKALESKIDYEQADKDFEEMQASHREVSRSIRKYSPPSE